VSILIVVVVINEFNCLSFSLTGKVSRNITESNTNSI